MAKIVDMNPLDSLHDIVLPQPVDWWPLAPGWWLLAALVLLALIAGGIKLQRHWRHQRPAKLAIAQLQRLDPTAPDLATQVQALLKRAAMAYGPREQCAGLHGNQWHNYLQQLSPHPWPELLGNPYQAQVSHGGQRLLDAASAALTQLPKQTEAQHAQS
ncbi:DUF4381 domain-containing protein [Ferrimonas pelagia]|uniref:DUF4381 domain-containing protein n=1 Tax=Ferrimonas pelagia TaxID=1177826 RepID=A0ABP9EAA1_9GAMM